MPYLIDGYNLLHALGLIQVRVAPNSLEQARRRLLGLLGSAFAKGDHEVTVVFDAGNRLLGFPAEQEHHGIHVRFATQHAEADDLIEQLIRSDSTPQRLAVVSDDHRLQQAAHRRRCRSLGCLEFVEEIEKRRRKLEQPREPEKPAGNDVQHWLQTFADIDNDPQFKELIEPPEFTGFDPDKD